MLWPQTTHVCYLEFWRLHVRSGAQGTKAKASAGLRSSWKLQETGHSWPSPSRGALACGLAPTSTIMPPSLALTLSLLLRERAPWSQRAHLDLLWSLAINTLYSITPAL